MIFPRGGPSTTFVLGQPSRILLFRVFRPSVPDPLPWTNGEHHLVTSTFEVVTVSEETLHDSRPDRSSVLHNSTLFTHVFELLLGSLLDDLTVPDLGPSTICPFFVASPSVDLSPGGRDTGPLDVLCI
jgi:hypothetical protein